MLIKVIIVALASLSTIKLVRDLHKSNFEDDIEVEITSTNLRKEFIKYGKPHAEAFVATVIFFILYVIGTSIAIIITKSTGAYNNLVIQEFINELVVYGANYFLIGITFWVVSYLILYLIFKNRKGDEKNE